MSLHELLKLSDEARKCANRALEEIRKGSSARSVFHYQWALMRHCDEEVNKASALYWEAEKRLKAAIKERSSIRKMFEDFVAEEFQQSRWDKENLEEALEKEKARAAALEDRVADLETILGDEAESEEESQP